MKQNCWEFKKCGREHGGINCVNMGVCSAATEKKLNNINNGTNGGRSCWLVSGTICCGEIQGTFAAKVRDCRECDFYIKVVEEEGEDLIRNPDILEILLLNRRLI